MPDPSRRDVNPPALGGVAERFAAVASSIEQQHSDEQVLRALSDAQTVCDQLAAAEASDTHRQLLQHVKIVFETWQQVWHRLGTQREFRLAVAREARLWTKRLGGSAGG